MKEKKVKNKGKWSIIGQKKMKDGRTSLGTRDSRHAATGIGASLQRPEALSCLFGGTVLLALDAATATIQWSPENTCLPS
jgi:hypothetical protein